MPIRESGGFYFTASDHERLIHRSKTFSDEAVPSGNGVAASVLCRLGLLLGEVRYLDAAERTLKAASAVMQQYPQSAHEPVERVGGLPGAHANLDHSRSLLRGEPLGAGALAPRTRRPA